MNREIELRDGLRDEDLTWLFRVGVEQIIEPERNLVCEGQRTNGIFVVIRGQFSVHVANLEAEHLPKLGAGELIGEISFLEGSRASATVVAERESVVLAVGRRELEERIIKDTAFAARLYRAFALVAERRLRNRVNDLVSLFEFGGGWRSQLGVAETLHQVCPTESSSQVWGG
jgi:CRP-like cAMP-binding protein